MTTEEDLIQERRTYNQSGFPAPYPPFCHEEIIDETKKPGAIEVTLSVSVFPCFVPLHPNITL
jgi:hypothetical protein